MTVKPAVVGDVGWATTTSRSAIETVEQARLVVADLQREKSSNGAVGCDTEGTVGLKVTTTLTESQRPSLNT